MWEGIFLPDCNRYNNDIHIFGSADLHHLHISKGERGYGLKRSGNNIAVFYSLLYSLYFSCSDLDWDPHVKSILYVDLTILTQTVSV